jgi:glycerol-3-phosphate acyltransferase PlsY
MMEAVEIILAGVIGYLLGAFPTGLLVGRALRGVDVRQHGSGHTGGLNVSRAAGTRAGALTAAVDVLLAVAAVLGARLLSDSPWAFTAAGAMAAVGHNWSIFMGFRGGIGLSSLGGALVTVVPLQTLGAAAILALFWIALNRVLRLHRARATIAIMIALGPVLWALGVPLHGILMGVGGAIAVIIQTLPDWHRQY